MLTVSALACSFDENQSDANGGAVVVQNGDSFTFTDSSFTGNVALQGAAIFSVQTLGEHPCLADLTCHGKKIWPSVCSFGTCSGLPPPLPAVAQDSMTTSSVKRCRFVNNIAGLALDGLSNIANGGAINHGNFDTAVYADVVFTGNQMYPGGCLLLCSQLMLWMCSMCATAKFCCPNLACLCRCGRSHVHDNG